MIQVIKRAFKVLETLSPNTRITLDSLSKATQLNKGTLCNILKTLIEIGYVEKTGAGSYKLSPKLLELTTPFSKARIVEELSQRHTQVLAKETRESCVASTLRENQVHIIAQTQYERSLMINVYSVYKDLSLYGSVSGQVLVSHLSAKSQAALTESIGFPGKEWNNINNLEDLKRSSREIVDTRLCTSWNREKEILSLAVPILDAQGDICASLGITMPISRANNGQDKAVMDCLSKHAQKMQKELIKENLSQKDFMVLI